MFKKLFTIGMLAGVMLFACNANAQTEKKYAPVYPQYSFWSNWSIGANVAYTGEYEHEFSISVRVPTSVCVCSLRKS